MAQRLFIAVEPSSSARDALAGALSRLPAVDAPAVRWVPPHNWHCTLQFLGEVPETALAPVCEACEEAAASAAPFCARLGSLGAFSAPRRARVVWVGFCEGAAALATLAAAVQQSTEARGHASPERAFKSHVTLARLKPPADVRPLIAASRAWPAIASEVTEITLFRSRLHPSGARYEALHRYPLSRR